MVDDTNMHGSVGEFYVFSVVACSQSTILRLCRQPASVGPAQTHPNNALIRHAWTSFVINPVCICKLLVVTYIHSMRSRIFGPIGREYLTVNYAGICSQVQL